MHWMQRIHHPTARKQCIDEGYRLRSGDIAFRSRCVSILHNCAIHIRLRVQSSIELGFPRRSTDRDAARVYARSTLVPPRFQNARSYCRRSLWGSLHLCFRRSGRCRRDRRRSAIHPTEPIPTDRRTHALALVYQALIDGSKQNLPVKLFRSWPRLIAYN